MKKVIIILMTLASIIALWILAYDYSHSMQFSDATTHEILMSRMNGKEVVVTGRQFRTISHVAESYSFPDFIYLGRKYNKFDNEPTQTTMPEVLSYPLSEWPHAIHFFNKSDSLNRNKPWPVYTVENLPWELNVYILHGTIGTGHFVANQWDEFTIIPYCVGFKDTTYTNYWDEHKDLKPFFIAHPDTIRSQLELHVYWALDSAFRYLAYNKKSPFVKFYDDTFPYKEAFDQYDTINNNPYRPQVVKGHNVFCKQEIKAYDPSQWFYSNNVYRNSSMDAQVGAKLNRQIKEDNSAPIIGFWQNNDYVVFLKCIPRIKVFRSFKNDASFPYALAIVLSFVLLLISLEVLLSGKLFKYRIKCVAEKPWLCILCGILTLLVITYNSNWFSYYEDSISLPPPLSHDTNNLSDNPDVFFFEMTQDVTAGTLNSLGMYIEDPQPIYSILLPLKEK